MVRYTKTLAAAKLAFVATILSGSMAQPYRIVVVNGGSMTPTYQDKSVLLTTRLEGRLYRGEVVVLNSPVGTIIKRVAYLPGDPMYQIWIGREWEDLVGITQVSKYAKYKHVRLTHIPEGEVYVLGDNTVRSIDSRTFGPIPIKKLVGVLVDQRPLISEPQATSRTLISRSSPLKPVSTEHRNAT